MYDYEVEPPVSAWQQISASLKQSGDNSRVVPVRSIKPLIWKFAIAAIFLGVVILSSLFLINSNSVKKEVAGNFNNQSKDPKKKHIWLDPSITAGTLMDAAAALSSYKEPETYSTTVNSKEGVYEYRRPLRKVPISASFTGMENISVEARPILDSRGEIIFYPKIVMSDDGQHIDITAPNGQQTRISSKFMNVLLYMNANEAESYDDAALESEMWQKKFEEWRNKILQNSFIPSSSNFFDIMELKELLTKDTQQ
jgi:hypothetical protein